MILQVIVHNLYSLKIAIKCSIKLRSPSTEIKGKVLNSGKLSINALLIQGVNISFD